MAKTSKKTKPADLSIAASVSAGFSGDTYVNVKTRYTVPITQEFILRLSRDLIEFADDPKSFKMAQFYLPRGILGRDFDKWVRTYPELYDSYSYALEAIGIRREEGILYREGNYNTAPVMRMMHRYDSEWDKADNRWENIRKPDTATVNFQDLIESAKEILQPYPACDTVPDKKKRTPEEVASGVTHKTRINRDHTNYKEKKP